VLLDAMMPGMDGFELAGQIRGRPAWDDATLMMLSSAGRSDPARCRQFGIVRCLNKPVKQSDLLDAITHALGLATVEPAHPDRRRDNVRPLRLLLAEDGQVNQKVAVQLLEQRGHRVTVANNGREAVAAWEGARERGGAGGFDVVLMDVQMPEMDGFEATTAIRGREKATGGHIPIIAMTANAMKGDREACLAAGMDGYVSKPFRAGELYRTIEGAVAPTVPVAPVGEPVASSDQQPVSPLARPELDFDELGSTELAEVSRVVEGAASRRPPSLISGDVHAEEGRREAAPRQARGQASGGDGQFPPPPSPSIAPPFDGSEALDRVGGSAETLKELVALFFEECPKLMTEIRGGLSRGDAGAVRRAAHTLKGSAGIFAANAAASAAADLESVARAGDLAGAGDAWEALQSEIDRLRPALAEVTGVPMAGVPMAGVPMEGGSGAADGVTSPGAGNPGP
jgi:CheY-like chemotaxis protein